MSGFTTCFASLMCLLVFLTGSSSALSIWPEAAPTFPSDPYDPFYNAFRTIPPHSVTADKLLTNFLHINPQNIIRKRSLSIHDNVVVMDGSTSIGDNEFQTGKRAVKCIMRLDDPAKVDARYAAVTFSTSAKVNFQFIEQSRAVNAIMQIRYPGGWTNTQAGLAEAKKLFEDPKSGRRAISKKDILLVTDGKSTIKAGLTETNALKLKNVGVTIHVVAVGGYGMDGIDEMARVASCKPYRDCRKPGNKLIYRVRDYKGLFDVVQLMLKKTSRGKWLILKDGKSVC